MEGFLISTYRFFKTNRLVFWLVFTLMLIVLAWGAMRITLEENMAKLFPDDERVQKLNYIFQNSTFTERMVVMVSVKDSATTVSPDSLVAFAETVADAVEEKLDAYGAIITRKIDDEKIFQVLNVTLEHLPIFFTEEDYRALDSITQPEVSREVIKQQYRQLISPSGLALKKLITSDLAGFSYLVLKKLLQLQYDENFEIYDSHILTKDKRHLIFFVQPGYSANETGKNTDFVKALNEITKSFSAENETRLVSYFGAAAVAVGNAEQLKNDTFLTVSLMVVLLAVFITGFFKDIRVLPVILIPVIFGGLFALFCIYLIKASVSILAIAAGSVILGIAVNYALHFLVHQRNHQNKEDVIKDIARPMTLGSLTTVLAFFSLQLTNASMLKDIGLFAGFSLVGAAICSLIFLPHLSPNIRYRETALERWSFFKEPPAGVWTILILIATPFFYYFATDVSFNSDMSKLNFMNDETRLAQQRLETINPASLHTLYLSCEGNSMEEALRKNDRITPVVDSLKKAGVIKNTHALSAFLLSDSLQQQRIAQWATFWSEERKQKFYAAIKDEGQKLKFSTQTLSGIDSIVERNYTVMDTTAFHELRAAFFRDNIIQKDGRTTIISLVNALPEKKERIQQALLGVQGDLSDRQMITNLFISYVHNDFNFIVAFTSILVFVILLISSGRIEITVITFLPMLITWIWVLGIMALVSIEFNIVNIMVSTFIFGLGDDYSIFVMDGLQQKYRTGKQTLQSVRTSIFLSVVTTISGLGVLIFAEHPALRSIAAIAIIGIVCVFIMSQTIEPFLFRLLITNRTQKRLPPMTARGLVITTITYSVFVFGSFFLTLVGIVLKIIPFGKQRIRLLYHAMIGFFTRMLLWIASNLDMKIINQSNDVFKRPGVLIANHSSFLDILITISLHSKVILLTNKWVWNSPVFGGVVRLADYYPVTEGAEDSITKLKAHVDEGYSVVVFPEGTRSADGSIGRFHKGAFYLAENLTLPVYPVLIHGAAEGIPKSTMYVNDAQVTIKILPAIELNDHSFGDTYSVRTKSISRYFKEEFSKLVNEQQTPRSVRHKLFNTYRYKGPVLEWYLRIKLKLENYYTLFNDLVPQRAAVLDLGCGYGFLCYTLAFLSDKRVITGVDYDEDKIAVAENGYLKSVQVQFHHADITGFDFGMYDTIIITDVLHYLKPEQQQGLLLKCLQSLNPGGKIIIRDGNADLAQRHQGTKLTELFSVKFLKFNKSLNELNYISGKALTEFVGRHGYKIQTIDQGKLTSNVIFVISK
ncbi:MAG: 1-acyl-sn-glycerol-3-phosphate acyltransferase [Cyclobacteriaceae bacterium]|nr:1-acyl-sn-glycerol-3-phosphate acyltransferase [Cyclobacteriaceae bacterium]